MKTKIKSALSTLRRHGGALALSGASQIVSSLTNFCIVLYLVRVLGKEDFGRYSLGFAAYLVLAAILAAMFAVQYVVNNPGCEEQARRPYAMHYVVAVVLTGLAIVVLAALLGAGASMKGGLGHDVIELALPVALATLGFSTRDFAVRIAFVERRAKLAFASNIIVATIVAVSFAAVWVLSVMPSASMALAIVAFSQLIGAAFILVSLNLPWRQFNLAGLRHAFVDSWQGGRWHALTSIVYSLRTQSHNFVILPILGLAVLAEVNAARTLLAPAVMALPPLYQVVMPRLAERSANDAAGLLRTTWLTVGGLLAFSALYCGALLLVLDWALPVALGASYAHLGPVVVAWCAVTVFLAARNGLTMGLEVRKAFSSLLTVNALAAVVAVGLVISFSILWGGGGAVWALALAEMTLCLLLYRVLMLDFRRAKSSLPEDAPTSNSQDVGGGSGDTLFSSPGSLR